jgi:hypothetical protein
MSAITLQIIPVLFFISSNRLFLSHELPPIIHRSKPSLSGVAWLKRFKLNVYGSHVQI